VVSASSSKSASNIRRTHRSRRVMPKVVMRRCMCGFVPVAGFHSLGVDWQTSYNNGIILAGAASMAYAQRESEKVVRGVAGGLRHHAFRSQPHLMTSRAPKLPSNFTLTNLNYLDITHYAHHIFTMLLLPTNPQKAGSQLRLTAMIRNERARHNLVMYSQTHGPSASKVVLRH